MKRIFVILSAIVMVSCVPKEEKTLITGTIENLEAENITFFYLKDFITEQQEIKEVKLDENNSFSIELEIDKPLIAYLDIDEKGRISLFIEPNENIHIETDGNDIKGTLLFSGKYSDNNTLLNKYNYRLVEDYRQIGKVIEELNALEFIEYMKNLLNENQELFDSYSTNKDLSKNFKHLVKTEQIFECYHLLIWHPFYHWSASFNPENIKPDVPEELIEVIKSTEALFSDNNLVSRRYAGYITGYLNFYNEFILEEEEEEEEEEESIEDKELENSYYLAEDLFNGKSLEYIKTHLIRAELEFGDFENAEKFYYTFIEENPSIEFQNILTPIYEKIKRLTPGNPAPEFKLTALNGETVSLEDFHGKVVYLDFWASWCGPCLRQVPHAKELKNRFKDEEDLVFVYISLDEDLEAWRNTIEAQKMKGVHLKTGGWDHVVPKSYNVKHVPSYFIIDRNGKIFDNRAKRPNSEGIDDDLKAALDLVS